MPDKLELFFTDNCLQGGVVVIPINQPDIVMILTEKQDGEGLQTGMVSKDSACVPTALDDQLQQPHVLDDFKFNQHDRPSRPKIYKV